MKNSTKWLGAFALGAFAFAGCSGGSSSDNNNFDNSANSSLPETTVAAITSGNQLLSFDARTPGTVTSRPITGLASGQRLVGIDYRYPAPASVPGDGQTGLYALGQNGTTHQLYRLAIAGNSVTATAVGSTFIFSPAPAAFGFDFNPVVDRIRLVEPTQNRNARLNPNTGQLFDDPDIEGSNDKSLAYAQGDTNFGDDPNIVGAAYTNVDADSNTGTVNYALDAANDSLVTQGRPASGNNAAVSPNTGQLFTVGRLGGGLDIELNTSFDIAETSQQGLLSTGSVNNTRIYGINLSNGSITGGARLRTEGANITGLAIVPSNFGAAN